MDKNFERPNNKKIIVNKNTKLDKLIEKCIFDSTIYSLARQPLNNN